MVLNSPLLVRVAHLSADLCQYVACNPERLSSHQVLYLIFCFPFLQFRRISFSFFSFLCYPSLSSSPSSDSDMDDDADYENDLSSYEDDSHSD